MPLVNSRLTEDQNHSKTIFFMLLHQTRTTRKFSLTLTKFDLRLTPESTKNPNFDLTTTFDPTVGFSIFLVF